MVQPLLIDLMPHLAVDLRFVCGWVKNTTCHIDHVSFFALLLVFRVFKKSPYWILTKKHFAENLLFSKYEMISSMWTDLSNVHMGNTCFKTAGWWGPFLTNIYLLKKKSSVRRKNRKYFDFFCILNKSLW